MNKAKAQEVARRMVKKGCSAFAGRLNIAFTMDVPEKKITPTVERKVMDEFYQLVENNNAYPVIQQMHAAEKRAELLAGDILE